MFLTETSKEGAYTKKLQNYEIGNLYGHVTMTTQHFDMIQKQHNEAMQNVLNCRI